MFADKTLLITGGTGSFGHAVVDRFLRSEIGQIRIFSRDEKKQDDMRRHYKSDKLRFYIGDVRNRASIEDALDGVDYVFHAAALKQVPSCEFFPMEAVRTNVIGTDNLLSAAKVAGVEKVVCLSTDKAVFPVNAMGMSKGLMEKVMVSKSREYGDGATVICGTRYGNVMASRGSVIPLFVEQIKSGRDLTITDPAMTRFLMSLEEAVELVIHAFKEGERGDIFVKKSPAATIGDLAVALMELFGKKCAIRLIGTRHGEKRFETLLTKEESIHTEEKDGFFRIKADLRDLNYESYFERGDDMITSALEYNSDNTERLNIKELVKRLSALELIKKEIAGK